MKKTTKKLLSSIFCAAFFLYWEDNCLTVTKYHYENKRLPKSFDQFKILHISDLQSKSFGQGQIRILQAVEKAAADIIVITGDLLDANRTDLDAAMELIRKIVHFAPVYFVSGNHDCSSGCYDDLILCLQMEGVHILENDSAVLERGDDKIDILGIADIRTNKNYSFILKKLFRQKENEFSILLSHRPEIFDLYCKLQADLIFTGHAHGGQIRLPWIGGLFAPNQGFLPKYTKGLYEKNRSTMVVSRGLGNSKFPFRIFNRPELIELTLHKL